MGRYFVRLSSRSLLTWFHCDYIKSNRSSLKNAYYTYLFGGLSVRKTKATLIASSFFWMLFILYPGLFFSPARVQPLYRAGRKESSRTGLEVVWIILISRETLLDEKNSYGDRLKTSERSFPLSLLVRSQGWAQTTDSTKQK